ncbi:MAG: ABC transporter ATP-binding protein/permease, partial [Gemmatimonadota bacterium]|nr:ABC transporter ATP-binding protein/permease [Gemmatimonadota bacterium]
MGGRAPSPGTGGLRPGLPPAGTKSFRERVGALRNIRPFLRLVWQTSPSFTTATLILRLFRALLPVATLFVGKLIIDEVVGLAQMPGTPADLQGWYASGLIDRLIWLIAIEFVLAVLSDVLGRAVSLIDSLLSEKFTNASSIRLMEHAATLDLEDFEDSELQDKLDRARRQTSGRMSLMNQLFGQAQDAITIVAFAAGLVVYAPWLILLLAIALIPAFLGEAHFNAQSYALQYTRTPERRELDYVRQTGASVETAKEVKIFGLNAFLIERYRQLSSSFYEANRKLAIRRAGWGGALTALGTIGYYIAYAYLAGSTLTGVFSIGDLTFLAGSFRRLRTLLEGLLIGFSDMAGQALYLDDLFSFFEIEPEINEPVDARPFPSRIAQGFVFENVGFIYPGAERWAVRHLSFTLEAGEVLALVGENGAGKTTLVKLLARLYDPDEGRILLDGVDLREYDLVQLRANLGVIFQDFVRYNLTARDNIAVGRIEARDDLPRIERAAERSLADGVIERLPGGYDQQIGKRFRGGVE